MLTARGALGPIMIPTPATPNSTPATRAVVNFSSAVRRWATTIAKIGVVALRIAATPLAI